MKTTMIYIAATLAVITCTAASSHASPASTATSKIVNVGTLNLSIRLDRAIFDARTRKAARTACEDMNAGNSRMVTECASRSVRQARPQRNRHVERHILLADAQRGFGTALDPIG